MYKIKIGTLIEDNDKLLLIKEQNDDGGPRWNIVKGTFDEDQDKDIFEAAKRECMEEVNVEVELKNLLNVLTIKKDSGNVVQFNLIASITKGMPSLSNQEFQESLNEHISEVRFFTKEELRKIKPEEYMSSRIYTAVQDWLAGKRFALGVVQEIT